MKKKINIIFYSLFFIASIIMESYCLIQLGDDLISVGGMSLVVLISAYLLIDTLINEIMKNGHTSTHSQIEITAIEKQLEEIENIQKAIYVSTKKSYSMLEERLTSLENNVEDKLSTILKEQKSLNDTIIKYNIKNSEFIDQIDRKINNNSDDKIDNKLVNIHSGKIEKSNNDDKKAKLDSLDIDMSDPNKKLSPEEIATLFEHLA